VIQRWDALHACNESAAAMRRLRVALDALAAADPSVATKAMQHSHEAEGAAGVIDEWREQIRKMVV
jgi:hypothetical protein